jgi:hypothetical protein
MFLLGALVVGSVVTFAQLDRASLSGTITDSTGAVIPLAKITATNAATHVEATTTSNGSGVYDLIALPIGQYTVVAEKEGFSKNVSTGVQLVSGTSVRLDFTLTVSAVSQQIEVKTEAPAMLMEERSSTYGTLVETQTLAEMPLQLGGQKRDPTSFYAVIPGIQGAGFQNNINGGQGAYSEVMMDGVSANYNMVLHGGMIHAPSVEVIDEFKVVQSIAPEYGPTGGSFISFVTKSGTNSLHGDAYEYVRNQALDGRSFFAQNVAVDQQNEIGFTLGGPVVIPKVYNGHDKTFFFANFTEYVYHHTAAGSVLTLPTPAMQGGDFSALLGPQPIGTDSSGRPVFPGEIYDPSTTRPDPNNPGGFIRDPFNFGGQLNHIDPAMFSSVSKKWQSFYPTLTYPNQIVNNYVGHSGLNTNNNQDIWVKIDQNIRTGRLNVSYKFSRDISNSSIVVPAFFGGAPGYARAQAVAINYTRPFLGGTALNLASVSLQRSNQVGFQTNPTDNVGANLIGLKGTFDPATPQVAISGPYDTNWPNGFEGLWTPHQGQLDTVPYLSDVVTITKGKHTIKFGGTHNRYRTNFPTTLFSNGRFYFNPAETNLPGAFASATGYSYASFLLGAVDAATLYAPNNDTERFWNATIFVQDEHRVTPKLTLTYGLNYELQNIMASAFDDLSQFDPTVPNAGAGGHLGAQTFIGFGAGRLNRKRFYDMNLHQFGPRFGFAYILTPKTTIRGSYGLGYGPVGQALSSAWADHQGFLTQLSAASSDGGITPSFNWDAGFPLSRYNLQPRLIPTIANGLATSWVGNGTLKAPEIQLLDFTIQRQLPGNIVFSAAYIGNLTHHIGTVNSQQFNQLNYAKYGHLGSLLTADINSLGAAAAGILPPYAGFQGSVAQALRPYPQYSGINGDSSFIGNSTYHGLQIKAQKTFSNGLSFLLGYTISKNLADVDVIPGFFAAGVQDAYNMRAEKSVTSVDMPQALVASYLYELPVGTGKRFLHGNDVFSKYVLGGWSLAGVHTYNAGTPLGFTTNGRLPTTGDGLSLSNPTVRPNVVSGVSPRTSLSCGGGFDPAKDLYLNRAAFADPAPFTFGNAPRLSSSARTCAYSNENISLLKRTPIKERIDLEFGADFFNIFNRKHFGGPDANVDNSSFGRISSAGPGRTAQLHMKFRW